jgi:hypothetical protein
LELDPVKLAATKVEELDDNQKIRHGIEMKIIEFLDAMIAIMPTHVAKNWTKFQQFFEFWRDFAYSGEAQMTYLYRKEFIAVLIDFYLEKASPLQNFSEKKHQMGNRYAEPAFNPLVQTVAVMVRRAKVDNHNGNIPFTSLAHSGLTLFELSTNARNCLHCREFYEKTLKDKFDPQSFGIIF